MWFYNIVRWKCFTAFVFRINATRDMCNLLKDFAAKVDGKLEQCEIIVEFAMQCFCKCHAFQLRC